MEAGDLAAGRQQHGREGGLRERVPGGKKKAHLGSGLSPKRLRREKKESCTLRRTDSVNLTAAHRDWSKEGAGRILGRKGTTPH